jgi:HAD superfamily hydrolase (TIGR01509 family)
LIDSEIIFHRINAKEMTNMGFPITVEKSIELFTGITNNDFDKIMLQEYGKTLSKFEIMKIIKETEALFSKDLKSIVDISQVMNYLEQKHINKCIASNGAYDYIITILTTTNLYKYFKPDRIFSAMMVNKGKPAPDVFLYAAYNFQVDPENCLVIEDSIIGIEAAKSANMPVIGFLGASHAQNLWYRESILKSKPTTIVNNAIELLDALKKDFKI